MNGLRTVILLALCCMLAATGVCSASLDSNSIGRVASIQGRVTARGTNGQERVLMPKSRVYMNDCITTSKGAKLQLRMDDDSILSQGENSAMTIDDFVYTPGDAANVNCTLTFIRGVFRAVTGKITALNPERFNVHTRMATIGIRGCDLAFRVEDSGEAKVYVLDLPKDHRIVIEPTVLAMDKSRSGSAEMAESARKKDSSLATRGVPSQEVAAGVGAAADSKRAAVAAGLGLAAEGLEVADVPAAMNVRSAGVFVSVRKTGEVGAPVKYNAKEVDDLIGATSMPEI